MAYTLFTRVLHGLSLSSQSRPTSSRTDNIVDQTKNHHSPSKRKRSLARLKSILSLTMKPQPPVSVIISGVPKWLDQKLIQDRLKDLQTLIRVRYMEQSACTYDLVLDFDPGTDAFHSLQISTLEPFIVLDHVELSVGRFTGFRVSKDIQVIFERKVLSASPDTLPDQSHRHDFEFTDFSKGLGDCYICRCELDGPFSTPCWFCRKPQCHECIRTHFNGALQDFGRFPATCCGTAFHPDVAKGILTDAEHARYKTRMEEWLVEQPLYCPIPTCSAFIPPRLAQQSHGTETTCHQCQTNICTMCKQEAHNGQPCRENKDLHKEMQTLQRFGYKQCPKCGTAIAKMYGCSHMQCTCGANWCWECRRRIDACNSYPCNGAEDGMGDVDHEAPQDRDSISNENQHGELAHEQPGTPGRGGGDTSTAMSTDTPVTDSKNTNLDDPALENWENSALDFGDDPGEEESLDIWSCIHVFEAATYNRVPRHWMTASEPDWWERDVSQCEIECMICWKPTKVALKRNEIGSMDEGEDKRKMMNDGGSTRRCVNCGIFVCHQCKSDLVKDD